jgi:hypothetical protein
MYKEANESRGYTTPAKIYLQNFLKIMGS